MAQILESKEIQNKDLNDSADSSYLEFDNSRQEQSGKVLEMAIQNFNKQKENNQVFLPQHQCSTSVLLFQVDQINQQKNSKDQEQLVQINKNQYQIGIRQSQQSILNIKDILQALQNTSTDKTQSNVVSIKYSNHNTIKERDQYMFKKVQKPIYNCYQGKEISNSPHFQKRNFNYPSNRNPRYEVQQDRFYADNYEQNYRYPQYSIGLGHQMNPMNFYSTYPPIPQIYPFLQHNFQNIFAPKHYQRNKLFQRKFNNYQKQSYPQQNMIYKNIRISIKLSPNFINISKNALVLPFSTPNFEDNLCKKITALLKFNIKQVYKKQLLRSRQSNFNDGQIFSVKAVGLQQKYRVLYFLKSPASNSKGLGYYLKDLLKLGVHNIFKLIDQHRQSTILIPDFEWGSLDKSQFCQYLINFMFKEINLFRNNYKCQYLKEIVIAVENCTNFEIFRKVLQAYKNEMM